MNASSVGVTDFASGRRFFDWLPSRDRGLGAFDALKGFVSLIATLALLAFFPQLAQAAYEGSGIHSFWGDRGTAGGEIGANSATDGAKGLAVNNTTGDVYAVDTLSSRVQRFTASGAFLEAWGVDVAQPAASPSSSATYEICTVAAGCKAGLPSVPAPGSNGLGGQFSNPEGVAINQASQHVYVFDRSLGRIQEFTSSGSFVRAFGKDVVLSGSAQADEQQLLTVNASAGQFKLTFAGNTTLDIPFNAAAAEVQTALNALASINAGGGSVSVSGGPGGSSSTPFRIVFDGGPRADTNQAAITATAGTLPLTGTATIATIDDGATGFEVCTSAAACKSGTSAATFGALSTVGPNVGVGLSVVPEGAPNAGDILAADAGNKRVQEFAPSGAFVRAFGWDVVQAGPGNSGTAFEVCNAGAFDVCKGGVAGGGVGQFGQTGGGATATPNRVVADSAGNVYTSEFGSNFRVQKFALFGGALTPQIAFNPEGKISGGSGTNADAPLGLAVDGAGYLYVGKRFTSGQGLPPAVVIPTIEPFQTRVLKVDPSASGGAGAVTDVFMANPGTEKTGDQAATVVGLAVGSSGMPIYTSISGLLPFIYRVDQITGLNATEVEATEVRSSSARLNARITPATIPLGTRYRFEYRQKGAAEWVQAPAVPIALGNGSGSGPPNSCPANNPPVCQVSQKIAGLEFEASYEFRLLAQTLYNGRFVVVQGPDFITEPKTPEAATGTAYWSSPSDTGPTLTLTGTVNPERDPTVYQFEYVDEETFQTDGAAGDGFQHGVEVPVSPATAGNGGRDLSVLQVVAGLDPDISYRYRLVATNTIGGSTGSVRLVEPPHPTDRFYEWVSRGESWGIGVFPEVQSVADSGARVQFQAQAFGQPPSLPEAANFFVSERRVDGWTVVSMHPDPQRAPLGLTEENTISANLGTTLWTERSADQRRRSEAQFGFVGFEGIRSAASELLTPLSHNGNLGQGTYQVKGGSADLSHVIFRYGDNGSVKLLPDENLVAVESSNLYEISDAGTAEPTLRLVNRADGESGAPIGGSCGAGLGGNFKGGSGLANRAVSNDGSVVYFSARPSAPAEGLCVEAGNSVRLFKRTDGLETIEVSNPAGTAPPGGDDRFWGASADGSVVFFTSPRQLTATDLDAKADLYLYDSSRPQSERLVQASAGELVPGAALGDPPIHAIGSEADVQGVLDSAADGSRVYFVALGVLSGTNSQGEPPVPGLPNLYVYERDGDQPSGRIAYLGALVPGASQDQHLWGVGEANRKPTSALPAGETKGDGHVLLFVSSAQLRPGDDDSVKDLYRYEDVPTGAETMKCLSCAGDGPFAVRIAERVAGGLARPDYDQEARVASADTETVVFTTQESLLGGDENATWDVYAWSEDALSLISGGTGGFGAELAARPTAISPDGKNVFFTTQAPLDPTDTNNVIDVYDARVGGGFPAQASVSFCIGEARCRPSSPSPQQPGPAGSATFSGPGNPTTSGRPRCKAGKVLRKGKCRKRKQRQRREHQRQPSHDRKGTR
jgi:hypothetical protein